MSRCPQTYPMYPIPRWLWQLVDSGFWVIACVTRRLYLYQATILSPFLFFHNPFHPPPSPFPSAPSSDWVFSCASQIIITSMVITRSTMNSRSANARGARSCLGQTSSRRGTNQSQSRPYNNQGYLQNGGSALPPGAAPLLPNQGRVIQTGPIRVLCIADVRGMTLRQS